MVEGGRDEWNINSSCTDGSTTPTAISPRKWLKNWTRKVFPAPQSLTPIERRGLYSGASRTSAQAWYLRGTLEIDGSRIQRVKDGETRGKNKKTFIVREESGKEGVGPAVPAFLWLSYLIYKWCQKKGEKSIRVYHIVYHSPSAIPPYVGWLFRYLAEAFLPPTCSFHLWREGHLLNELQQRISETTGWWKVDIMRLTPFPWTLFSMRIQHQ